MRRWLQERLTQNQRRMAARALMAHAQFLFAVIILQAVITDGKVRGIWIPVALLLWIAWAGVALWLEGVDGERGV